MSSVEIHPGLGLLILGIEYVWGLTVRHRPLKLNVRRDGARLLAWRRVPWSGRWMWSVFRCSAAVAENDCCSPLHTAKRVIPLP